MSFKPLTKEYLLKRGSCCNNGCSNCPYKIKKMITIYTIAYNEEMILPFFIVWYRDRFPDCKIIVYDNYSTDNTKQVALNDNCEVIYYKNDIELINKIIELKKKKYTANKISKRSYSMIKRNFSWEKRASDYVKIL